MTTLAASNNNASTGSSAPSNYCVHGACILAMSIFGLGSIVGALGMPATNPLAFTFVREICSGALLLLLSFLTGARSGQLFPTNIPDAVSFLRIGFLLFLNQTGYIVGIELAGPVTASVWQPSAPLFTVAISMLIGLEKWNLQRVTGVFVAFGGCAAMVLLSDRNDDSTLGGSSVALLGNAMFFLNCSSVAGYILLSKPVLQRYPALTVTAWSYNVASVFMLAAAFLSGRLPAVQTLICPSCPPAQGTFFIPRATLPALAYYIVFQSVASWGLILWANQYATGTLVVGYTVLQPVTALLFATLFLVTHWVASCADQGSTHDTCLNEPGTGTLCGMLGVFCGLWLVVQTEPNKDGSKDGYSNHYEHDETKVLVNGNHDAAGYGSLALKSSKVLPKEPPMMDEEESITILMPSDE